MSIDKASVVIINKVGGSRRKTTTHAPQKAIRKSMSVPVSHIILTTILEKKIATGEKKTLII